MACKTHTQHEHKHGPNCGHMPIQHEDHMDYLHDGHLHHVHEDHIDEHILDETPLNSSICTPEHQCHDKSHHHGPGCGHESIPHGDHIDYLVNGHLHRPCGTHCDHHGMITRLIV